MTTIHTHDDATEWNALVHRLNGHPLQLWGWGEVKARHNWSVDRLQVGEGGAQLLIRRLPRPFGPLVYVPRGPFGGLLTNESDRAALITYIKATYAPTLIKVEPDTTGELRWGHWKRTSNHILMARTAVMHLTLSDDELMADMSKKTRQYIRKSAGEGIEVVTAHSLADIDECLAIYKQTAARAGFSLHGDEYYHDIYTELGEASPVFMAKHNGSVVAFLWPVITDVTAFELYGGMNETGQSLRANYHLKWSVIQAMKQRGVTRYDVNGLLNDGVSAFKRGFIPKETMLSGTYDLPVSPLYPVWDTLLPTIKRIVRRIR